MKQLIENWINDVNQGISRDGFVSMHVNEILGKEIPKENILDTSIDLFFILLDYIDRQNDPLFPLLVIPLRSLTNKITFNIPHSIEDILHNIDEEPPSLYLMSEYPAFHLEKCEEYKAPLSFNFIKRKDNKKIYTYYREFRCNEAIELNWEFSRCLYVNLKNPKDL